MAEHPNNNDKNLYNAYEAKSAHSNISWNNEVKVIKYNKYN